MSLPKNYNKIFYSLMFYFNIFCSFCDSDEKNKENSSIELDKERTYFEFFYQKSYEVAAYCYSHPVEIGLGVVGVCLFIMVCVSSNGTSGSSGGSAAFQNSSSDIVVEKVSGSISEAIVNNLSTKSSDLIVEGANSTLNKVASKVSDNFQTDPHISGTVPIDISNKILDVIMEQDMMALVLYSLGSCIGFCYCYAYDSLFEDNGILKNFLFSEPQKETLQQEENKQVKK
jgi:hypothetical protein